eukprot:TRINITY_DN169_c5_g1_i1.p1 TRINITY_DN169_c5_g1~~TRINITY_DN169_c5_g1_i1.p1  ORF type:complete len:495 (+),score=81.43 TRINITY_DN169_c5_g1_i1:49-1533(+)
MPSMAAPCYDYMPEMPWQPTDATECCAPIELLVENEVKYERPVEKEEEKPEEAPKEEDTTSLKESSSSQLTTIPSESEAAVITTKGKRKTKLCKLWLEDRCRRRRCPFAHGEAELRVQVDEPESAGWAQNREITDFADEVRQFGEFMSQSEEQKLQRSSMRNLIQSIVVDNIDREAITKMGCQTDLYDSDLELVIEVSSEHHTQRILASLDSVLRNFGVATIYSAATMTITFEASAMNAFSGCWLDAYFKVKIIVDNQGSFTRREASLMNSALSKCGPQRVLIPAVIGIFKSHLAIVPDKSLIVMCLAFLIHSKTHPSFSDLGWLFKEFFRFYSDFDFNKFSVCLSQETPFPTRSDKGGKELSIIDVVTGVNTTTGVTTGNCQSVIKNIQSRITNHSQASNGRLLTDLLVSTHIVNRRNSILGCPSETSRAEESNILDLLSKLSTALSDPINHTHKISVRNVLQQNGNGILSHPKPNAVLAASQEFYLSLFSEQ